MKVFSFVKSRTKKILIGVGFLIGCIFVYETILIKQMLNDRLVKYRQAEAYAMSVGKPLLVVGNPYGNYPCGDVTVDIKPNDECPVMIRADICDLSMFDDKSFGSVFASHVLEHVEDIENGFRELCRVADKVFISYPFPHSLSVYALGDSCLGFSGHLWKIYSAPPETEYIEYRRILFR